MSAYATSLIDMNFTSPDTGFVTGRGPLPLRTSVILYTTDGGQSWEYKFQNTLNSEYCWKIQRLTDSIYFGAIEDFNQAPPKIVKSTDGGMTWTTHTLQASNYNVEGIGFVDSLHGWAGGDLEYSFETFDGGLTWEIVYDICPNMNRLFRLNDSLLFATGSGIWKYGAPYSGIKPIAGGPARYAAMICSPNPVSEDLTIDVELKIHTHLWLAILDENGRIVEQIENANKNQGKSQYTFKAHKLNPGTYFVALKNA